jgi:septum formation protein
MAMHPMFRTCRQLVLASASPRRKDMLARFGLEFDIFSAAVDETPLPGETPESYVRRMAGIKAQEGARRHPRSWILGADTAIALEDGAIIGKPENRDDALSILRRLAGSVHFVLTGFCLANAERHINVSGTAVTRVQFMEADDEILRAYIATGEPMDKAGAYGIQGLGSFLVEEVNGSCTNVIGLPLSEVLGLLIDYRVIEPVPAPGRQSSCS